MLTSVKLCTIINIIEFKGVCIMSKDNKSVPFSTRWTGTMDSRLEELREVMMLTKQDIVRMAMSEFLVKHRDLIDSNIEYKEDPETIRYEDLKLIKIESSNALNSGWWISGINEYFEDGTPVNIDDLVKIEVNVPKINDISTLPELLNELKISDSNDSQIELIKSKLDVMLQKQIYEEYILKFTKYGLEIKDDPKFRLFLENSIKELVDELKNKDNR